MDHRDAARHGRADHLREDTERMLLVESDDWVPEHDCPELGCPECKAEGWLSPLPAKFEVCSTCDGRGRHVNPSIDSHGLTAADFAEDPDFAEDYRAGVYDVACYACDGRRVELVVDREACAPEILARYDQRVADHHGYLAEVEAERRMGC